MHSSKTNVCGDHMLNFEGFAGVSFRSIRCNRKFKLVYGLVAISVAPHELQRYALLNPQELKISFLAFEASSVNTSSVAPKPNANRFAIDFRS